MAIVMFVASATLAWPRPCRVRCRRCSCPWSSSVSVAVNHKMTPAADGKDIAGTVIFLASRAGAFTTGSVIPVDGGISTL